MASGFRLYWLEALNGHARKDHVDFGKGDLESGLVESIRRDAMVDRLGMPVYRSSVEDAASEEEEPNSGKSSRRPYLRIDDSSVVGTRIDVTFRYGREGDYDSANAPGKRDVSLRGRAATRTFRNWIYLPKAGPVALLAAEVIGRQCTGDLLAKWISVRNSETCGEGASWVRWMTNSITDASRVAEVIREGAGVEVVLRRSGAKVTGGAGAEPLELRQNGIPGSKLTVVTEIVTKWLERKGDKVASGLELLELIDADPRTVGALGFDDGEVKYMENGKVQTIRPSTVEKIFVYPTGDRLDDAQLRHEIAKRATPLIEAKGVNIDFGLDLEEA